MGYEYVRYSRVHSSRSKFKANEANAIAPVRQYSLDGARYWSFTLICEHYIGHRTDTETGLVYCQNRYYDPANGRWLTRDPIGTAGGVNLYSFHPQPDVAA